MTLPMFHEKAYLELRAADGTPAKEVSRCPNENLVDCVCGKLYRYPILVGSWGILFVPAEAGVCCPFCGCTAFKSIRAHSGAFFNASLVIASTGS